MEEGNLLLFSGGLESSVLAYDLRRQGVEFELTYFDLGQDLRERELRQARVIAGRLGLSLQVVDLSHVVRAFSATVGHEQIGFEWDRICVGGNSSRIPSGLPILLAIGSYLAQLKRIGSLYLGVEGDQEKTQPGFDEFRIFWSKALRHFAGLGSTPEVKTPYLGLSKAQVVRLGADLGVPLQDCWSCSGNHDTHCGECKSCRERRAAFSVADISDNTEYKLYIAAAQTPQIAPEAGNSVV